MILPEVIKVGAYTYKVTERDKSWYDHSQSYGQCSQFNQTIDLVTEGVSDVCILDTFLHEINHCIWHVFNIQDTDAEERIVTVLSTGLTGVFVDNPDLVQLITDGILQRENNGRWINKTSGSCAKEKKSYCSSE